MHRRVNLSGLGRKPQGDNLLGVVANPVESIYPGGSQTLGSQSTRGGGGRKPWGVNLPGGVANPGESIYQGGSQTPGSQSPRGTL